MGLRLNRGLVLMSDTRTNSGIDNFSTYRKMFHFCTPGDRMITILTAGNLATTQAVISLLEERSKAPEDRAPSIFEAPTMFQVARLVGDTVKEVIADQSEAGQAAEATFGATLLVSGQIGQQEPRLFLVYPEGNFIETSSDTQYLQIGEIKYGRPILIRAYDPDLSFSDAIKLLIVSFDSTLKSNLSVGLPIDVQVYEADSLELGHQFRIEKDDPHFQAITKGWRAALNDAFADLPDFDL